MNIVGSIEEVARRSLVNCHVPGLHSLVLDPTPGKMIRMFYASEHHELYLNDVSGGKFKDTMSLALHSHHCDLVLVPVLGQFHNVSCRVAVRGGEAYDAFRWQSFINTGTGKFERCGETNLTKPTIRKRGAVKMDACDLHTVYVDRGAISAWLVYEGAEDPNYDPTSYSNADLSIFTTAGLYEKMTPEMAESILRDCKLI